jgi:hypothetical protein
MNISPLNLNESREKDPGEPMIGEREVHWGSSLFSCSVDSKLHWAARCICKRMRMWMWNLWNRKWGWFKSDSKSGVFPRDFLEFRDFHFRRCLLFFSRCFLPGTVSSIWSVRSYVKHMAARIWATNKKKISEYNQFWGSSKWIRIIGTSVPGAPWSPDLNTIVLE